MWGRREEAAPAPKAGAQPALSTPPAGEPVHQAPSASTTRSPAGAERGGRSQAQIGKSLKLLGEITGSEDLYIDGEVEGTIELRENSLTVGPNGNVRANVKARSITVLGRLEGNVKAGERIEIRKTGSLEGDLVTPRIVIEDGAVFRGSIDILKPGVQQAQPSERPSAKKPVRPPAQKQAPVAAAAARPPVSSAPLPEARGASPTKP
jgi:cytoskeletal protein CcmA (bactofilin family)